MRHLFSTGLLSATVPVVGTIAARAVGNAGALLPVDGSAQDGAFDGDAATQSTLNIGSDTNYQFLVLDLGSQQTVSRVVLQNVTTTGAASTVSCWVSNANSTVNAKPPVGGLLASAQAPGALVPLNGTARTGRYVYLFPDTIIGAGTLKIGEAKVWVGAQLPFAELQGISTDVTFQSKPMRGPTSVSQFAVDAAYYDGAVMCKAEWADFDPATATAIVAAATDPGAPGVLTLKGKVALPPMNVTFEGEDTSGKKMRLKLPRCYLPGLALAFKRDDWGIPNVAIEAYLSDGADGDSPVAIWEFEN